MSGHNSTNNGSDASPPPASLNSSPKPLKAVIVGAGIGGLFAAITLRAAGHHVEIYESSRFAVETGAAVHVPPNVNGLLRRFGLNPEDHGAVLCEWVSEGLPNGETTFRKDISGLSSAFANLWQSIHRIDLHNALKAIARDEKRAGKPVVIHLQSRVASVDIETTSITLSDGTMVSGDFILGADGIHSVVRKHVRGKDERPHPSGTSAFRFLIPTADIKADPTTAHFVERTGELRMINGDQRKIVMYPCRYNKEMNFVALHPDTETSAASEDWNASGSKDALLKVFDTFSDAVKELLAKAHEDTVKVWRLLDLESFPQWTNGNVALVGDAAHPFLPYQGQGAAQSIEDAGALSALFPLGTLPSDIPNRLKLYMECRYERATIIQQYSRGSRFDEEGSAHSQKDMMDPMRFTEFNFDHDAYDHASAVFKRHLIEKAGFRRMPLSFGPTASPRQDLDGQKRGPPGEAKWSTKWVTVKTKKSYLQTLMPMGNLKIDTWGGWTTATFSVTKLENLEWLGGRGYSHFGLYVHNVVGTDTEIVGESGEGAKTQFRGDFLPVLFENMADPIITGREELGFSKVFATLDEDTASSEYTLRAGWEGTTFCTMQLSDLVLDEDAVPLDQAPTLSHRVVPSPKGDGTVEADYVTSTELKLGNGKKEKMWKAGGAKIEFCALEGEELRKAFPTLANVVEGLRKIEISQVVASGVRASA